MRSDVENALRLGWTVAEVRGRAWRPRKEPKEPDLPTEPLGMLPLRSQRDSSASQEEAIGTLQELLDQLAIAGPGDLGEWPQAAAALVGLDARIQQRLTTRDEDQATAYLVGRGLAECYWSYGGKGAAEEGAQLTYLFKDERVRELTRMLGRLPQASVPALTSSAVAGSLEAWSVVGPDADGAEKELREQVRRWYQLLVIGQDPTTFVTPSRRLGRWHYWGQALRTFWPQAVLALAALALTSTFFLSLTDTGPGWIQDLRSVLGVFGFSAFAAAGLLTKAQSAAQRVLARMQQDQYTDLVAISVTNVPPSVPAREVEAAVRKRGLTLPTA